MQIIQYKIMGTVDIPEVTLADFQSCDYSEVLDNEVCWIIGNCAAFSSEMLVPFYQATHRITALHLRRKPILISEFFIYVLDSLYLR
jgi:hypothetical protein